MENQLTLPQLVTSHGHPVRYPKKKKRNLREGEVSIQSFKHYLLNIQLLAYKLKQTTVTELNIPVSGFYMLLMLHGQSVFEDSTGAVIGKAYANSAAIAYMKAGQYKRILPKGLHKIVVLNFRSDWFNRKAADMESFHPLIEKFEGNEECCVLPHCPVAKGIFKLFKGLKLYLNDAASDIGVIEFLNNCVDRYHQKLAAGHYDTKTLHELKANALAAFVKHNFTNSLVDNTKELARKFTVSERTLKRLSLLAFGRPLHKQVMELRMLYGLKALMCTKLTIQEIARQMGYSDPYYFSRAFKNRFGVSPREVRFVR